MVIRVSFVPFSFRGVHVRGVLLEVVELAPKAPELEVRSSFRGGLELSRGAPAPTAGASRLPLHAEAGGERQQVPPAVCEARVQVPRHDLTNGRRTHEAP
eukprot:CAMPEP_0172581006 /NCGR_PEP_ID=MMETSP1068-20121228/73_1 /TAXON_ID=35684 /ORGANISM="Pseudopedinella elastica, Strain CCMP716" /LENGTH=99 /DNA_ID=CAMNT_0013373789 /DNA_START=251 /DNA_END=546 /DNA_ORIENTATION=-